jgi:16S rRNA G966 N2-methylase RsmD
MNERITEELLRSILRELGYYDADEIYVEEQKSTIEGVQNLLRSASKTGGGGKGAPEFIITSISVPDLVIVAECKADVSHHESPDRDRPKDYAVDGAIHYANFLSKGFNVIALAVSGQRKGGLKVSCFLHARGAQLQPLTNRAGKGIKSILPFDDFAEYAAFDKEVESNRLTDLMAFSTELHEFMRDHAKLTESEKPLLVSGTLIALRNKPFAASFGEYSPDKLQRRWHEIIKEEFQEADIPQGKKLTMSQPYSSIAVHPELGKATKQFPKGVLHELISRLHRKVWPFISIYHDFDVVGQFYGEFLKYTGGDKKALGIVLTPKHITELFSLLANVKPTSRVLDLCCGTGGFLISSMVQMARAATTKEQEQAIKKEGLIGVEQQPNMFSLAASNMILRGDGKANLHQGSCFDSAIQDAIKKHRCNVGMINPPYSQSDEEQQELVFVRTMLECLVEGGTGIAIVPMSCAIASNPIRQELLENHTLEAVMSMPDELFYPVGTITCILVFTAHVPHETSARKTWFGYWKNDGFIKTKHKGRIDGLNNWTVTRDAWIDAFRNRDDVAGLSVKQRVTAADEWCAEAYMETDLPGVLREAHFEQVVRDFAVFNTIISSRSHSHERIEGVTEWKLFSLGDLFEIKKGRRITKADMRPGDVPFISAIDHNNGLREYCAGPPMFSANSLTVVYNGNGVTETFYQPKPFCASDDVNVLEPKGFDLTPEIGCFLGAVIRQERYRFSYGRKWNKERMEISEIHLPATKAGIPDWKAMESYIQGLPFAGEIRNFTKEVSKA